MKLPYLPRISRTRISFLLLLLVLIGQLVFDVYSWRTLYNDQGKSVITSMIIAAANGSNRPAVVEPVSGKVYIPEAKLVLPPYGTGMTPILYNYMPTVSGSSAPTELQVAMSGLVNAAESRLWIAQQYNSPWHTPDPTAVFKEVPGLQACVRGLHVFFVPSSIYGRGMKEVVTKPLKDGRTMYVYDEQHCAQGDGGLASLAQYLQQAQSY